MNNEFIAWAIDTRADEGHSLLGRYFFDYLMPRPPSLEGCRTALFRTRQIARQYCKTIHTYEGDSWKPRVIRVKVTVQEMR